MKKRIARKVTLAHFSCGCPVPGYPKYKKNSFIRAMRRLKEIIG